MNSPKDFRFLEHVADLEFVAYGKNLEECFQNSARAMWTSILKPDSISEELKREINIKAKDLRELLHDFLSETLFLFETESLVFKEFKVSIKGNDKYELSSILYGQKFNPERHIIETNIKAITYHEMEIKRENGRWSARVICDI